jgi:flavin-binding protein dodecin
VIRRNLGRWPAVPSPAAKGNVMADHNVYKIVELTGSSETSIEDAVQSAVARANETLRNLRWVEVTQVRGHIESGKVAHYQVMMKVGFTLE